MQKGRWLVAFMASLCFLYTYQSQVRIHLVTCARVLLLQLLELPYSHALTNASDTKELQHVAGQDIRICSQNQC